MNRDCELVLDLLSLYAEGIASESTCRLVEEHLADCAHCRCALERIKETVPLPMQTDTWELKRVNRHMRTKKVFWRLSVVLLVLTLLYSVWVLCKVPVWLTAEEAIEKVELVDGMLHVYYSDRLTHAYSQNGSIFGAQLRLRPHYNGPQSADNAPDLKCPEKNLWYLGALAEEADTLLWQGDAPVEEAPVLEADWTIRYVFWISLVLGGATMLGAWTQRKRKLGKILMCIGLLPLCCAVSCWFVTGGRFAIFADSLTISIAHGNDGNLIHIGVLTTLSWTTVLSVLSLIGVKISEKRRVQDETEL